ncbi:MAG: peroxiredoxin [Gammaproteobacteria bacterium]|nr:peroxiredoxin [Gammaproteobacteria bacterium]MCP4091159.1 peroxiredoxin [Gammaproteobacteria bacterium]MCP4277315.1 peroxiredoxin [Gammaproteobacteria bacterium]MCP4831624.1 peroxiredoxin [Gammaproteobacteria bacterium]MCP4927847.1 peroxiredoxin [Gammaproteobacteria bacterium]
MSKVQKGNVIPALNLPATGDQHIDLKSLRGKKVVLYFYPRDSTPGCTTEGQDFAANHAKFKHQNTVILGISRDTIASHEKFRAKYNFPFDLMSDSDEKACNIFNVIKEKNMYGRKVMGIERSTFLIDEKGRLQHEWRKVKVKGHVDEVLETIGTL